MTSPLHPMRPRGEMPSRLISRSWALGMMAVWKFQSGRLTSKGPLVFSRLIICLDSDVSNGAQRCPP